MYFIYNLSTYSAKNKACLELLYYIKQYDHVLIQDIYSLNALSKSIETKITEINELHPKMRPIFFIKKYNGKNYSICRVSWRGNWISIYNEYM